MLFRSEKLGLRKSAKIIVCGLDASGKTTIVNWLKPPKTKYFEITPTVGFSVEYFKLNKINFTVFDMSGHGRYRDLWESFYADSKGVIYVVDSSDSKRIHIAKQELFALLKHKNLEGIPIIILANKSDIKDSLDAAQISDYFDLHMIDHPFHIVETVATTGKNINQGLIWLTQRL